MFCFYCYLLDDVALDIWREVIVVAFVTRHLIPGLDAGQDSKIPLRVCPLTPISRGGVNVASGGGRHGGKGKQFE